MCRFFVGVCRCEDDREEASTERSLLRIILLQIVPHPRPIDGADQADCCRAPHTSWNKGNLWNLGWLECYRVRERWKLRRGWRVSLWNPRRQSYTSVHPQEHTVGRRNAAPFSVFEHCNTGSYFSTDTQEGERFANGSAFVEEP